MNVSALTPAQSKLVTASATASGKTSAAQEPVRTSGPLEPGVRFEGTVKWFFEKKGYGYITAPEGEQVFVHHNAIQGSGFKTLEQGEVVHFEAKKVGHGFIAQLVIRTSALTQRSNSSSI